MKFNKKKKEMSMFRSFTSGLILLVCLLAGNAWAAPKLLVEQSIFDFGEVLQGQKVRHSFIFSNGGDEPLLIEKVKSSCGCTAALVSTKTLAPGENGEVQANFDSTRFHGAVTKTVSLYSNDPAQPITKLYVKGKIKVPLSIMPAKINLGQVMAGTLATTTLTLQNQGDVAIRLDKVQTSSPALTTKLSSETLAPGQSTLINIELVTKSGQNSFRGYIVIPAQGSLKTDLRIPVQAIIVSKQSGS
jgi:hypothetical protein